MKKFITLLILLLPTTCFSQQMYVGGGLGNSNLNYDLQGWLQDQEQSYLDSQGVGFLNIPLGYSQQFNSRAKKVFVGYEFNKWFAAELSFKNYGTYTAKVHIDSHVSQATGPITSGTPPVTYNANVDASALGDGSATATASGVGLSMLFTPIHGDTANVFFRLGIERTKARYSANGEFNYQYSGSASNGLTTTPTSGSGAGALIASNEQINVLAPVIGFGIDWKVAKQFALRTEIERAGDPRHGGTSIDMFTLGLLYKFK